MSSSSIKQSEIQLEENYKKQQQRLDKFSVPIVKG